MNAEQSLSLARRFTELPPDKRRLFLDGLREEGIDFSLFPIAADSGAPDRDAPSYSQQRMWFLWQLDPDSAAYNLPCAVRLTGPLHVSALKQAFGTLVERHETLRTVFQRQPDNRLRLIPAAQSVAVEWSDLSHIAKDERAPYVRDEAQRHSLAPFDLAKGPLLRVKLLKLDEQQHVLLLSLHHSVADGWSMNVLIDEFSRLYESCRRGAALQLTELPIQYGDYALWQRRWLEAGEAERQLEYWRGALGTEHPILELPTDYPRPVTPSFSGRRHEFAIAPELTDRLHALAKRSGVTPFMLLLAAFQIVLQRYSGQSDIRVGVPIANRNRIETERLIGFFVNTQVLKTVIDGQTRFADLLQQVKQTTLAAQAHQDLPFEQLVEALQPARSLSHNPLFQVVYNHQPQVTDIETLRTESGLTLSLVEWESRTTPFDLSLDTYIKGGCLLAALTYATDLFETATIERLAQHWQNLLAAIVADPQQYVGALSLLSSSEQQTIGYDWNTTTVVSPCDSFVHALIEQQVENSPAATALIFGEQQLTYEQLNARANQLAHRLIEAGVGPDVMVGIALGRSPELVIALLATLKAGGAYVPLDPAYPQERLNCMLANSGVRLLVTQSRYRASFSDTVDQIMVLEDLDLSDYPDANPACVLHRDNLLCLLYTSGSTGQPKGVAIGHGAISAHIQTMQQCYAMDARDVVLHFASINFDWGTEQWLLPLVSGACFVMRGDDVPSAAETAALIERHAVSVVYLPTLYARQLAEWSARQHKPLPVRCFNVAGEALEKSTFSRIQEAVQPQCLVNGYGPTETVITPFLWLAGATVDCNTMYAPIGQPVPHRTAYIWDQDLNVAPLGVIGELQIGGPILARGYHLRPGLTAERFVPDPLGAPGGRLYRTGDLTRRRPDGVVDYIGRSDHQVKIRGFRVELGEIETLLLAQPGVDAAVVVAKASASGTRLVAYVSTRLATDALSLDTSPLDTTALRQSMANGLPDYMVPSAIVVLSQLPLNPNGKVDRHSLPEPVFSNEHNYVPPQGELETALAEIWAGLLGVERVGRNDNFFELGGHSLLAIELLEQLRQRGWSLEVRALFRYPQLSELADTITQARATRQHSVPANGIPDDCTAIQPDMLTLIELNAEQITRIEAAIPGGAANIKDIYPLAPLQEGMLFHHVLQTAGDAYVTPSLLSFDSKERLEQFIDNLNQSIVRHDILRTAVLWDGLPEAVQVVQREARVSLEWFNEDGAAADTDAETRLNQLVHHSHFRIDVSRAPMIRAIAAADPLRQRWLLQLPTHHLVLDHTTLELLVEEIGLIQQGRWHELSEPVPFRNFVAQAKLGVSQAEHEKFFQHLLGDVVEPTAPFNLLDVRGDGTRVREARLTVPEDLARRIRQQARQHGFSAATFFHLAWAIVLSKTTGNDAVVFGTVLFGRMHGGEGVERALGMFINTLPVCIRLGNHTLQQCLEQMHNRLTDLLHHEHASLSLAQRCSALPSGTPLFSSLFNYRHSTVRDTVNENSASSEDDAWTGMRVLSDRERTNYPFNMSVDDLGAAFVLSAQVDESVDAQRVCEYLRNVLQQLVGALENGQILVPGDLNILADGESSRLRDWGVNSTRYTQTDAVHRLIEQQARRQPRAEALIFNGSVLSYAELNSRANRLAHRLRQHGVRVETKVGVAVERSLEMVVGLVAILKTGATYVPLDLDYPAERLGYMIEDSGVSVLLTQSFARARVPQAAALTTLELDKLDLSAESTGNLDIDVHGDNLAYVIYTSGSTGKPKGVANRHCSLTNCMTWMQETYQLTPDDTVLHKAAFGFDVSVWEIFWPLTAGARLVVANPGEHRDPARLIESIRTYQITVVNFVPSMLQAFLDCDGIERDTRLKYIICGGEAMPAATQKKTLERLRGATLQNLYGPTEAAIHVTRWTCRDDAQVPIGRPIACTQTYVLDAQLNPVPIGVAGELYLGGISLARGYLNRAGLSAERFVPDPLDARGGRLYRTGDLVRWNAEGQLDYLGRIDHQVKIRGVRIELGEIEARLREQVAVLEAVVLALDGANGKRLVSYIVPSDPTVANGDTATQRACIDVLRAALKTVLPDYLMPAHWVFLERLPLTPNGKLDRNALPQPATALLQQAYVAPRNTVEQQIAAIWAAVLKLEKVGATDNFFELGGDSIISLQVVSRARQAGIRFTPKDLFQQQTVRDLAAVAAVGGEDIVIEQGPVTGALPLLPIQRVFFEQDIPERQHWNQSVLLRPVQPLHAECVERALQALVVHHDALRLRFVQQHGAWGAEFRASEAAELLWSTALADWAELDVVANEAQRSLCLERGPLLRAALATTPDGQQRLLLIAHHLVVDGVSWRVLLEDLQMAYRQANSAVAIQLPAKTSSVQRWAERLQLKYGDSAAQQTELDYWQTQLRGAAADLPCAHRDGGLQSRHAHTIYTRLNKTLTHQLLQEAPAAYRTQINDLLLTALASVICRWSGRTSALVQLEGHGREDLFADIDLTRTVGWFTSLFPVNLQPAGAWAASLKQIKEQLRAVPDKGLGFGALHYFGSAAARQCLSELPQPRITFNYLGQFDASFIDDTALFQPAPESAGMSESADAPLGNWLSLNGRVYGGELQMGWTFSRAMFDDTTVQHLADEYAEALRALIEFCCQPEHRGVTPSDFPLAPLNQAQLDALPIAPAQIETIYPLAPMQQGMLFHTLYWPQAGDYINQLRIDVDGLETERFRAAWQAAIDTHDILRTGFVWQAGGEQPVQVVYKRAGMPFTEYDWRTRPGLAAALDTLAQAELEQNFELTAAPLLRLVLVRTGAGRHHLIYTNHHILMDGWSSAQLLGEVLQRYAGQPCAPQAGRYSDYIAWLQRQDRTASATFWQVQVRALQAPTRLAASLAHFNLDGAAGHDQHMYNVGAPATQALHEFCRRQKVTINTLVQATWALLLQRCSGHETVVFGATVAGRPAELNGVEQQIGLFINTLPVITTPRPDMRVADWLQALQTHNLSLREHEHTALFDIQRWAALSGEALFDHILVFENYPVAEALQRGAPDGLRFGPASTREQTNYPLTVAIEVNDALALRYDYDRGHFSAAAIAALAEQFGALLQTFVRHADAPLGALPRLNAQQQAGLRGWSTTAVVYSQEPGIHALIERQAAQTPAAPALFFGAEHLSYAQLNGRANRLAHHLIDLGVGPDVLVGVAAECSFEMVIGLLAILKAGGAYVPLDPAYPRERLAYMLEASGVRMLLSQDRLRGGLPIPAGVQTVSLEQTDLPAGGDHNPPHRARPDNLAYMIYTSGSTGWPKGVTVSHGALLNHMHWMQQTLALKPDDRVLQKTAFSFDASVWEFWLPLLAGAQLVLAPPTLRHDFSLLWRLVQEQRITTLQLVPSLLQTLLAVATPAHLSSLKTLLLGGEALSAHLLRQLSSVWNGAVYNLYGPTEATIDATYWRCSDDRGNAANTPRAPIGRPIANTSAYILDGSLNALPVGDGGELYLSGAGLARGYHRRAGLTAERFVPNPFDSEGSRLYRTGDMAQYRPDGVIDYIGRSDEQVKIRGLRIELGEIEACLLEQSSVREAVVLAQEGRSGLQLVGYVVLDQSVRCGDSASHLGWRDTLRHALLEKLPDYMVPAQWVSLERLPFTPNGKLDRKALSTFDHSFSPRVHVEPHTELEQQLAAIWRGVLKLERLGLTDNFFDLGGHSLLAINVVARIQLELGITLTPQLIFKFPTLGDFAAQLAQADAPVDRHKLDQLTALLDAMEEV